MMSASPGNLLFKAMALSMSELGFIARSGNFINFTVLVISVSAEKLIFALDRFH